MRQRHHNAGRAAAAIAVVIASLALVACGSSDDDGGTGSRDRPAPDAGLFPATEGRSLQQVLAAATGEGPVVSFGGKVLRVGENRVSFGVFTPERDQITDAEMAIYAAPGGSGKGPAVGPFPARIEDLTTESQFRAKTTVDDPDAAAVAYVTEIKLDKPGPWSFIALIRQGDSYLGSIIGTPSLVGQYDDVPKGGDKAPRVTTPTADSVDDISEIDTRVPPDDMHDVNLANVLGKKPVALLFATPALCQSRVCGPVVDEAQQVKRDFGDEVAFIHMEVYEDNDINKGLRPQLRTYNLPSEPWLFVIDRNGVIRTAIEGAFGIDELEQAVERVTG